MNILWRMQIYKGSTKLIEGDFDLTKINTKEHDRGVCLDNISLFNTKDPTSKEIILTEGKYHYIPYRVLSEFIFSDPWLSNKYYSTIFKRVNKQTFNIYIYYPFNLFKGEISNEKADEIMVLLNNARLSKKAYIKSILSAQIKDIVSWLTNRKILASIKAKNFHIDKETAILQKMGLKQI